MQPDTPGVGAEETFRSTAIGYADGGGSLTTTSSKGVRYTGAFVYVNQRQGEGTFTCDDGRLGPFSFVSTGTRGAGSGLLRSEPVTFTFGGF